MFFQSYASTGIGKHQIKSRNHRAGLCGCVRLRVNIRRRQRYAKAECCSLALCGLKLHGTVMPLQNLVGLRQSNSVAFFFGGEVELENFVLHLLSNAQTLIADFGNYNIFFAMCLDRQLSALRHGLNSVDHHVEKSLLHQVQVRFDEQRLRKHDALDVDAMLLRFRGSQQRNVIEQSAEVNFHQMQFACAHEVHQGLYDTVDPVNFAADDVHVPPRIGIELRQL